MQEDTQLRDETGATTAEYAVTTCGAVGLGTVLYKLLTSEFGQSLVTGILDKVLEILPF